MRASWFPILLGVLFLVLVLKEFINTQGTPSSANIDSTSWHPPDINLLSRDDQGNLIRYGRELIAHTSVYLGPKGTVAQISNGMNCQNCHVEAGTRAFGNPLALSANTYPKFRPRSGTMESLEFRINECMERSMNGTALDSASREMKAIKAYLKWIGEGIRKGTRPEGFNTTELAYLSRAADPVRGKTVFVSTCARCHGLRGQGLMFPDSTGFQYPPLWGEQSYNVSAGLYRISRLAAFIKYNMPFSEKQIPPQLSDEDAWDVAAYVVSQPRPEKKFAYDWPRIETKPPDYPFGPYADGFSEQQHKYGPFQPIIDANKKK